MKLIIILLIVFVRQASPTSEKKLIDHLLTNYSIYPRPVLNRNDPVNVTFGFNLIQIMNVVERDQYITTKLWMRMTWINEFLKWKPHMWDNITHTRLPRDKLWTPDIFLQEDIGDDISSGPDKYETPIVLQSTGQNMWLIPVKLQSACIMDVKNFPFDRQTCKFVFTSWTHDKSELDLIIEQKPIITWTYVKSSEWKLLDVGRKIITKQYACCPNPFVEIQFYITLQRKPLYYIYNVVIPCCVQMIIILFTFFLPPDSGERIGVVITVLLVFAVYLEVLSSSLPKTSNSTPALSHFYITAMIESACSLIATCFVLAIHFKGTDKGVESMPNWLRRYFLEYIGKYIGVPIPENLKSSFTEERSFTIKENAGLVNEVELDQNGLVNGDVKTELRHRVKDPTATLDTLVDELHTITSLIHDSNRQDEIEEEWQLLAKVFDRIFFFIFFAIFFITTIAILLPVYLGAQKN